MSSCLAWQYKRITDLHRTRRHIDTGQCAENSSERAARFCSRPLHGTEHAGGLRTRAYTADSARDRRGDRRSEWRSGQAGPQADYTILQNGKARYLTSDKIHIEGEGESARVVSTRKPYSPIEAYELA